MTYGMGSILGGIAFFVGTSYSELTGTANNARSNSDSFLFMHIIIVVDLLLFSCVFCLLPFAFCLLLSAFGQRNTGPLLG